MRRTAVSHREFSVACALAVGILVGCGKVPPAVAPVAAGDKTAQPEQPAISDRPLIVYCAASQKPALEAIVKRYEAETRQKVELRFGASQEILAALKIAKKGDLFLPADDSYVEQAKTDDLVGETWPVARMKAVVLTGANNPLGIASLGDLLNPEIKLAQANPDGAAIGALTRAALEEGGRWQALAERTTTFVETVNQVANVVKLGSVDAGIVWEPVAAQHPTLATIALPELDSIVANVVLAELKSSPAPAAARQFARYITAADRGLAEFRTAGFADVAEGKPWDK